MTDLVGARGGEVVWKGKEEKGERMEEEERESGRDMTEKGKGKSEG